MTDTEELVQDGTVGTGINGIAIHHTHEQLARKRAPSLTFCHFEALQKASCFCINIQPQGLFLHKYTETTAFYPFSSPSFQQKSHLLEEQIDSKKETNHPPSEDKQLFVRRRTAVRLPYEQLSDRSPTAVRLHSDSCRTGKHGFLNLHFLLISRF